MCRRQSITLNSQIWPLKINSRCCIDFWTIPFGNYAVGHARTDEHTSLNTMLIPYVYYYWVFGHIQCSFREMPIEEPVPVLPRDGIKTTRRVHFETATMLLGHQFGALCLANFLQNAGYNAWSIITPIVAIEAVTKLAENRKAELWILGMKFDPKNAVEWIDALTNFKHISATSWPKPSWSKFNTPAATNLSDSAPA